MDKTSFLLDFRIYCSIVPIEFTSLHKRNKFSSIVYLQITNRFYISGWLYSLHDYISSRPLCRISAQLEACSVLVPKFAHDFLELKNENGEYLFKFIWYISIDKKYLLYVWNFLFGESVNVQIVVFLLLMLVTLIVVDAAVVKNFNKVYDLQPGQQNQRGFGIRILSLIVSKSVLCK